MVRSRRIEPVTDMIAPTERCPWRKRVLCGEVHDDNAWAMGGVAGHAGLFASARDVDTLLCYLRACLGGAATTSLPAALVREFWTRDRDDARLDLGARLGHAVADRLAGRHVASRPTPSATSASPARRSGSTSSATATSSCSPTASIPRRDNEAIKEFRPLIHDLVNEALDGDGEGMSDARPAVDFAAVRHVHLIAIAGVAMAALAGMLRARGLRVTGLRRGRLPADEHAARAAWAFRCSRATGRRTWRRGPTWS